MKKTKLYAIILIAVNVVAAVIAYILLPESVVIQFSLGGENTQVPKLLALLLPTAIGIVGAVTAIMSGEDGKSAWKRLLVSGLGIVLLTVTVVINLSM